MRGSLSLVSERKAVASAYICNRTDYTMFIFWLEILITISFQIKSNKSDTLPPNRMQECVLCLSETEWALVCALIQMLE